MKLKKYLAVMKFSIKTEFTFKVNYFAALLSFAVRIFVFSLLWEYILSRKTN